MIIQKSNVFLMHNTMVLMCNQEYPCIMQYLYLYNIVHPIRMSLVFLLGRSLSFGSVFVF